MKSCVLMVALGLFASWSMAAEIYKCTDAGGKIGYTDKPCKGKSTIFTPRAAPTPDADVQQRREKRQQLLRAYHEEQAAEQQQAAALEAEKEKRAQYCQRARIRYRQVTSAGRMFHIDEDGEHVDYTDTERADAIAGQRADIEKWCD